MTSLWGCWILPLLTGLMVVVGTALAIAGFVWLMVTIEFSQWYHNLSRAIDKHLGWLKEGILVVAVIGLVIGFLGLMVAAGRDLAPKIWGVTCP